MLKTLSVLKKRVVPLTSALFLGMLCGGFILFSGEAYSRESSELLLNKLMDTLYDNNDYPTQQMEETNYRPKDEYLPPTVKKLSKIYWATGKMSENELSHVVNYIKINDCDLYNEFSKDDFEWQKLVARTKDYLAKNKYRFQTKIEVIKPIEVGEYNIEKERFLIAEKDRRSNITRLSVRYNSRNTKICGHTAFIDDYPKNIVLEFGKPFALLEIPVGKDLAQAFLMESRRLMKDNAFMKANADLVKRYAYLRLKVNVTHYKGLIRTSANELEKAVMLARVDGIEIYGDPNLEMLLFKRDIRRGGGGKGGASHRRGR